MFGLSKNEMLQNIIRNACHAKLSVFRASIQDVLINLKNEPQLSELEVQAQLTACRKEYLNAVCNTVIEALSISDFSLLTRFNASVISPSITGLSEEITTEYLDENGISAGSAYIMTCFAITGKPLTSPKAHRIASMLTHYQNDLMESVLIQLEKTN